MGWKRWLPRLFWEELPVEEAMEIGLEQATRWRWAALQCEWLDRGITLYAKVIGPHGEKGSVHD